MHTFSRTKSGNLFLKILLNWLRDAATGGLLLPKSVVKTALNTLFFNGDGRATESCYLVLPMSSFPFISKSIHPESGAEGWLVTHTRCVQGSSYKWTSFVWFRKTQDEAVNLAEEVLTLNENADGGAYELPEQRRARLPPFVDPLRLVLPFPDLRE